MKALLNLFWIFSVFLFSFCSNSNKSISNIVIIDLDNQIGLLSETLPTDQIKIGTGFNTATNEERGDVIVYNGPENMTSENDTNLTGQETYFELQRIKNNNELRKIFGLNLSASLKTGIYKGSVAAEIISTHAINKYSETLLVKVLVKNPAEILKSSVLTEQAKQLLRDKESLDFIKFSGDEFVHKRITGGELYMLYEFSSQTISQQESIRSQINLAVDSFVGKGRTAASLSEALSSIDQNIKAKVYIHKLGYDGKIPANDPDSLIQFALHFPELVNRQGSPRTISVVTKPLNTIPDLIDIDFNPILEQKFYFEDIALKVLKIYETNSNLNYVIENQNLFLENDFKKAEQILNENEELLRKLMRCAESCRFDLKNCNTCNLDTFQVLTFTPKRNSDISPPPEEKLEPELSWIDLNPSRFETYIGEVKDKEIKTIDIRGEWYPYLEKIPYGCGSTNSHVRFKESLEESKQCYAVIILKDIDKGDRVDIFNYTGNSDIRPGVKVFVRSNIDACRDCGNHVRATLF